ncbi:oligosaccharide flippase family protein [Parafilimonas terrae]|uniref:Membrane protein involved in the export of O-antigen and teichoic acid n=1 Tax=Parafilimonas terrae TaxID=1465490 RepID=A0A1I5Z5L4_9BACT|nr:polysaccharide biosynthesis C-terminal domain-containing protein [Parafilimonas terrae]SFQ51407.1 Membrane protein involved in the export of O-antigen and teichoic acid [Parafilimonas terrae]
MLSVITKRLKSKFKKDKDFKEIAKGGGTSFIVNAIGMGFGYFFVILVSKIYGSNSASIYGRYVLVTLLLRIGSIVTRFGCDTSMLRFVAAFAPRKLGGNIKQISKKFSRLLLLFGIITSTIVVIGSSFWGKILKMPQNIVILSAFFILPMAFGLFYSQSLRGLKKIGISSFLRTSALPTLNFILLPLFLLFVPKQSILYNDLPTYAFFTAILITSLIGFIFWKKFQSAVSNNDNFDASHSKSYKQLINNSYPLLLVESMSFLSTWIDQLMLGVMGSNEDVGILNLCVKYGMLSSLSLQAINTISAPKFSEYFFNKDYKNLAKNFRSTTKIIFWTTFPIVTCFIIFPSFFLNIMGKSFSSGSLALVLLSVAALINVMTGSVGILLQMTGHQKIVQNVLLISVVIEVFLNAILIPSYGVTGAAIASISGTSIRNFSLSYYVKKYFGFNSIYFPGLRNLS